MKRKIALRSSKGKRIISISIRDDINEKELMKILLPVFEAEAEGNVVAVVESEALWTDEMKALWKQREDVKNHWGEDMGVVGELETRWHQLRFGGSGIAADREEWADGILSIPMFDYLPKILELPDQQRSVMVARMRRELEAYRKAELTIRCGGDPEEVVWHGLTRAHLMDVFKKEKGRVYTVGDVASLLSISYNQAYNHIVPFLKKQGVSIK
jgi:hypothetical protein